MQLTSILKRSDWSVCVFTVCNLCDAPYDSTLSSPFASPPLTYEVICFLSFHSTVADDNKSQLLQLERFYCV